MKTIEELFADIEGHAFSAVVNLASDWRTFVRILADHSPVRELRQQMPAPNVVAAVCQRIQALAAVQPDPETEHPFDAALAAYLWLLHETAPEQARGVAPTIAQAPNGWWARRMAEQVGPGHASHAEAG